MHDSERNGPKSGLASPDHRANLLRLVLGFVEASDSESGLIVQHFSICKSSLFQFDVANSAPLQIQLLADVCSLVLQKTNYRFYVAKLDDDVSIRRSNTRSILD